MDANKTPIGPQGSLASILLGALLVFGFPRIGHPAAHTEFGNTAVLPGAFVAGPAQDVGPMELAPQERFRRALPQLSQWPSARARMSAEGLVQLGPALAPAAREGLTHKKHSVKAASAWILGRVGSILDYDRLKRLLFDPKMRRHGRYVLEALGNLDERRAKTLSLDLLEGPSAPLQRGATYHLSAVSLSDAERERVLAMTDHESKGCRRGAFEILRAQGDPEVHQVAARLLGDLDNRISRDAFTTFLEQPNEETLGLLKSILEGPRDRRFAMAILCLIRLEQLGHGELLASNLIEDLRELLGRRDPFMSLAGGLGLLAIGYRKPEAFEPDTLAGEVLPRVVKTVLSRQLFRGFSTALAVAIPVVSTSTGWPLTTHLASWDAAWKARGEGVFLFTALNEATPVDVSTLRVTWIQADSDSQVREPLLSFVGEAHLDSETSDPSRIVVPSDVMEGLLQAIRKSGILRGDYPRDSAPENKVARVRLDTGTHSLHAMENAEGTESWHELEEVMTEVYRESVWQRYPPSSQPFKEFWREEIAWLRENQARSARLNRWARMIERQLDAVSPEGTEEPTEKPLPGDFEVDTDALEDLHRLAEEGATISRDGATALAKIAMNESSINDTVIRALDVLVTLDDPLMFSPVSEALLGTYGNAAREPVTRIMVALNQVATSLTHRNPEIRVLAIRRLADEGDPIALDLITPRLFDQQESVQMAAVQALGALGTGEAGNILLDLSQRGEEAVRVAALEAIGQTRPVGTKEVLLRTLEYKQKSLVTGAIRGLGHLKDEDVVHALINVWVEEGPETPIGLQAAASLRSIGGAVVQRRLGSLIASNDQDLRREALFLLAETGDLQAIPGVLELLEVEFARERARAALVRLTVQDFGSQDWKYKAMAKSRDRFEDFFLDAVDSELRAEDLRGKNRRPSYAVPKLLDLLLDSRWYVRDAACVFLRELADVAGPSPSRFADRDQLKEARRTWQARVSPLGEQESDEVSPKEQDPEREDA